ncbi:hypothetical protein SAMN05421805_104180 [Saccharopolyspora antimicrobica]|uniref:Uncharacterized protein n=1 Tax=Saccharopolyspora antimicrobica TaxID=455193 RepID=A0A1I4YK27_9PSEU|nr:hypothetical protein [Saccharopolyspora antimicrobica]RKT82709.1 hypothetical protein ATL45_0964 [Saccharopolyspora antimicrobica]SFN38372.1 hypothetical protein SAMN05421805_104180 [Saccharopolyspora antimicrobica]
MSNQLTAWLRTIVPAAWSALVTYLVTAGAPHWLTGPLGAAGDVLVVPAVLGAVYAVLRLAERRLPAWAIRILLGSSTPPTYQPRSNEPAS